MIIIWGTRPYFRKHFVQSFGLCDNCGYLTKRQSFFARQFFHLYYIPLIPTQGLIRFHRKCSRCQVYRELSVADFEALVTNIKEKAGIGLLALMEGEQTVVLDDQSEGGEPIALHTFFVDVVDWLYDAKDVDFLNQLLERIYANGPTRTAQAVEIEMLFLQGQSQEGITRLQGLASRSPDDQNLAIWLARVLTGANNHSAAAAAWANAAKLETEPAVQLHFLRIQANEHFAAREYQQTAALIDQLFAAEPALQSDKELVKMQNKSRKKAG